ncbi:putative tyrosine-protein kinase [Apostichopus japonicus]|uniref:Tyrosine-protein kinase n=1 Tax=Stichopus japonicus TaxID=307972 RepID=A0A2G8JKK6_STIJA|nr:putative tyrosine-protein kinase [Apostichopus japonicus]
MPVKSCLGRLFNKLESVGIKLVLAMYPFGGGICLLTKQKDYRDLSREILNLKCHKAKVEQQLSCLQEKLQGIDPDQLPLGIDLKDQQSLGPIPQTGTASRTIKLSSIFKPDKGPSSNKDVPLEDEAWYHGALPRQETEELLKQEGDFIARFKSDASDQYVLSCRSADKQRHFTIVKQDDSTAVVGLGVLKGPPSTHLVSIGRRKFWVNPGTGEPSHVTQTPMTKASNAMIRNPISKVKDEHDLRHKDILLDTKLGQGHFGDVHKATFKNKPVSVKKCKATVDAAMRRKFLSEAYILKNYNHPNIVKLIGVATDRHPIYIVMELVQGQKPEKKDLTSVPFFL